MASVDIELKKCVTPEFRVSFPALFKPKVFKGQEASEAKFGITMLFNKKQDLTALKKAALAAGTEKWGADRSKWPKFRYPTFRDGDDEKGDTEGYENTIFVSAKSKNQPGIVGPNLQPILNERDIYAGCFARAEVIAYAYDQAGNKGIGFSLQNVQKLREGDPLSGRKDASDVFDAVEDLSDDAGTYESGDSLGF